MDSKNHTYVQAQRLWCLHGYIAPAIVSVASCLHQCLPSPLTPLDSSWASCPPHIRTFLCGKLHWCTLHTQARPWSQDLAYRVTVATSDLLHLRPWYTRTDHVPDEPVLCVVNVFEVFAHSNARRLQGTSNGSTCDGQKVESQRAKGLRMSEDFTNREQRYPS